MLQVSDPHLSAARDYGVANFDAAVAAANAGRPDLVVASGDLVLDDPDDRADQDFARSRFDRLTTRWRALPGNHDIGDTPPDPWMGDVVTDDRRGRWIERWGPGWWVEEAEEWVVVGLDAPPPAGDGGGGGRRHRRRRQELAVGPAPISPA
jgi:3',5'-cyclic AMP phosphodiesterase CpdA